MVTHEYRKGDEVIKRRFAQPWDYPDMLVANIPSKSILKLDQRDKRLFAITTDYALA